MTDEYPIILNREWISKEEAKKILPETIEGDYCEALQVWHHYYDKLILKHKENEEHNHV